LNSDSSIRQVAGTQRSERLKLKPFVDQIDHVLQLDTGSPLHTVLDGLKN
jgi:hypothetical protein